MSSTKMIQTVDILGVDIDNVLSDTDLIIREIIKKEFGVESTKEQITSWNYSDSLPVSREQEEIALNLFHEKYCKFASPIPGAVSALRKLYDSYTIWLITGRPPESEALTREWLRYNQMFYHKLIHTKDKVDYSSAIDLIIEDNGTTAFAFAEKNIPTILFRKPWNKNSQDHSLIYRVDTWNDVLNMVSMKSTYHLHLSQAS